LAVLLHGTAAARKLGVADRVDPQREGGLSGRLAQPQFRPDSMRWPMVRQALNGVERRPGFLPWVLYFTHVRPLSPRLQEGDALRLTRCCMTILPRLRSAVRKSYVRATRRAARMVGVVKISDDKRLLYGTE
jgi:hypothetical protein